MKLYKITVAVITTALLIKSLTGDPVCMMLIYQRGRALCGDEYGGLVSTGAYVYDEEKGLYSLELRDQNGVVSELIYDPKRNEFTDNYYADYISYALNSISGEYVNRFAEAGAYPDTVIPYANIARGTIGDGEFGTPYKLVVLFGEETFDSFTDNALIIANAVANDGVRTVEIYSSEYSITLSDLAFYAGRKGIESRVRRKG